jgi:hypothetical protein
MWRVRYSLDKKPIIHWIQHFMERHGVPLAYASGGHTSPLYSGFHVLPSVPIGHIEDKTIPLEQIEITGIFYNRNLNSE